MKFSFALSRYSPVFTLLALLTFLSIPGSTYAISIGPFLHATRHKHRHPHSDVPPIPPHEIGTTPEFWGKIGISLGLVLLGGMFSGLTLGLMGLDELHLRVLASSSESMIERRNAEKVLGLLKKGRHWVLVVLLLANVIVNESLPVFLDTAIGGGMAAIVISTVTIVIFGEIIPQAVSVRYGLSIGAKCAPLVLSLMWILAPVAYPIAKLLDWVLGVHGTQTYKKRELKSFLGFHVTGEEPLREEEVKILGGVLELGTKRVEGIMTKIEDVFTLSADAILDQEMLDMISKMGYSRIPVHLPGNPSAFIGLLLVKQILRFDRSELENVPVSSLPLSVLPETYSNISCWQALDYFQTGRAHLLLISRTPGLAGGAIGIITLEDIIEEIISEEIVDETDIYEDNVSRKTARRAPCASVLSGTIIERSQYSPTYSGPPSLSRASTMVASPTLLTPNRTNIDKLNDETLLGLGFGRRQESELKNGSLNRKRRGGMDMSEIIDLLGSRREEDLDSGHSSNLEQDATDFIQSHLQADPSIGRGCNERTRLLNERQDESNAKGYLTMRRNS
ncbi:DUF21-domain-containing protein [Dendrothele bispora CBS 962.96]|uniref:DUF21-domain-containing protein n=1 Tax=Dendrothele bispora (strain CBS 962.96) TaxID=1314807 RepID=A0A4S8MN28_DENBC|nr:DUF21-domain-containing protein [Dendrothele bispora CBS 962.96]